jgi:hypothetical protein
MRNEVVLTVTCLHGHQIEVRPEQYGQKIACPACQLKMVVSPPREGEPLTPKYEVLCDQGHTLRVKSKYIGTQIRCPECQGLAWVTVDRLQVHVPKSRMAAQPVVLAAPIAPPTPAPSTMRRIPAMPVPPPQRVAPITATAQALPVAATPVVVAPVVAAPVIAAPVVAMPVAATPAIPVPDPHDIPIATLDDNIPVAGVADDDEGPTLAAGEFTKAERHSLRMTNQALTLFNYSVMGYCGIQIFHVVMSFILFILLNAVSGPTGFSFVEGFAEVVGWIINVAMLLNVLLFAGSIVLSLFTPTITLSIIWFSLALLAFGGYVGWRIYIILSVSNIGGPLGYSQLFSVMNLLMLKRWQYLLLELLFISIWCFMIGGCWQLAKYCKKPLIRQNLVILLLLGIGAWVVMAGFPLLREQLIKAEFVRSKVASWIIAILHTMLFIGIALLILFQHMGKIDAVRYMINRKS